MGGIEPREKVFKRIQIAVERCFACLNGRRVPLCIRLFVAVQALRMTGNVFTSVPNDKREYCRLNPKLTQPIRLERAEQGRNQEGLPDLNCSKKNKKGTIKFRISNFEIGF